MDSKIVDEILEELSSTLERIETQSAAILEFIKEKGIAKDEELAPYLERAATASSVRWRATRVRLEHLFAGLEKSERQAEEKEKSQGQKDSKEREDKHKPASVQEAKQKDGVPNKPRQTEQAKAGEDSHAHGEQVRDASVQATPKAAEQEGKPSDENDKKRTAA